MRCSQAKDLISLAMDERLEEYDRARLVEHLEACPDCVQQQEVLDRGRELLAAGMAQPSENFEWKVQLAIQRELRSAVRRGVPQTGTGRFWLPLGLTTGLVAMLVVVSGWLWLPRVEQFGTPAPDLTGGVRPTAAFLEGVRGPNGMGHQVGAGSVGPLPGKDPLPFGVGTPLDYDATVLLQERDFLMSEVRRLQIENALLREAAARSTLSPDAARGEQ